jgi:hypothetical protein
MGSFFSAFSKMAKKVFYTKVANKGFKNSTRPKYLGKVTKNFTFTKKCELSVLLIQYCAGGKIETNEMGRACGAYGGG